MRRRGHVPGEVGTWVFILGDMTVFAVMFGVLVYYRGQQPAVFHASQEHLTRGFGLANTLLLLTSSLCVVLAVNAMRAGTPTLARRLLPVALACGVGFSVDKVLEWSTLVADGHKPAANDFYMYFFVMTGIHFFHLLIGMGVLVALLVYARRPQLTARQLSFVEGGACFWHMVDLLWIVLFALLYLLHT